MTRQQTWSLTAHQRVVAASGDPATRSEYRTHCMKTPILLHMSGVCQTLAFLLSRKAGPAHAYARDLAQVYLGAHGDDAGRRLLRQAQEGGLPEYLVLSRDLAEVAVWFRRFAQIEIPADGED